MFVYNKVFDVHKIIIKLVLYERFKVTFYHRLYKIIEERKKPVTTCSIFLITPLILTQSTIIDLTIKVKKKSYNKIEIIFTPSKIS